MLGNLWIKCDRGISLFQPELQEVLPHRGPVRPMMTDDENAAYDALLEVVTIFRGCAAKSASLPGTCWSLNKDVANAFPLFASVPSKETDVAHSLRAKALGLAVKLKRQEEEIITFAADVKMIRPADRDRADLYLTASAARQKKMDETYS